MHQVQPRPQARFTPADLVTSSRFVLAVAVAVVALVDGPRWLLGLLAGIALLTDCVDGRLARATRTVTSLGARLDQEADAVLILVLSAVVASDLGPWVLGIGSARYAFGAAFALVAPLRTPPVAPRRWCRVVAATTGIVLAAVAALPLPHLVALVAVAAVAALLAESFVHEAVDRWRAPRPPVHVPYLTLLALVVVWAAMSTGALRLPVEAVAVVLLALIPVRRLRLGLATLLGVLLGVLVLATVLDLSFQAVFDRDFDPVGDWSYLGSGVGVLGDSIGTGWAKVVAVLAALGALLLLVGLGVAVLKLVELAHRRRRASVRAASVLTLVWVLGGVVGLPVVGSSAASLAVDEVQQVRADVADSRAFARQIAQDPYADRAGLLDGLKGKDVLLVFVESYGRVAVQDTTYSRGITKVLDQGTRELAAAGYQSRSAFLTSPTFGAGSWLAHSSLQSGLWVNSERRYRQLLGADRMTLTSLFGRAGWRTVFDVPADTKDWPQGKEYYGFQQYYDSRNVGYRGPKFGYAPIPDQYTLAQFRREQLVPARRKPVFAELDLVSSHHPWTPLPHLVPWDQVGDGSLYNDLSQKPDAAQVFKSSGRVKKMYGKSIEYTWQALASFLTTYPDPDLVVIALGDHQPHTYVSGKHVGHDVPISVISQDPAVLSRIAGWDWQHGLRPAPDATVWRMDTFRDRFLAAFD